MKKSASFPTIVLLILLCLAAPLSAYAEIQGVATVVAIRGTVAAQNKSGASRNLSLKSQIFQEDVLKTDKNGQLQIMFTDNSIISLGRNSEMKIAEYRWQPGQKDGALKTQVKEGSFRVMGGALAKEAPQNFKTETPTATIGIRGSMYTFRSTRDSLTVVFQGGKGIEVYNDLGKVTISVPGFGTRVVLNTPPVRPSKFTEQQIKNLNSQLNGGGNGNGGTDDTSAGPLPLADIILPPLVVPPPPVLPPVNEYPTAPDFTLPPPPPTDGIYAFEGILSGISTAISPYTGTDTFTNSMSLGVNWYNHRIFGVAYDTDKKDPVFFFGSVTGSTISDFRIFGIDEYGSNYAPTYISGEGVGAFAGAAYDFFAFGAQGASYDIQSGLPHDSWVVGGGGQQVPGAMTPVAPRGSANWQGFMVGLSAELANPSTGTPYLFQTQTPDDFTLAVNKDAGTIGGTITTFFNDTTTTLQIGGSIANSVYLRDDLMAALISGSDLKPYGNFMVSAHPSEQFSSYFTWGYWEIAYTDTMLSPSERFMVPASQWIAGPPTPPSAITALSTANFTGTYTGKAFGTGFNGATVTPLAGTCSLTANFGAGAYNGTVTGAINFPGVVNLSFGAAEIPSNSNYFGATVTGINASGVSVSGPVKGMFFGPNANAVGGSFAAGGSNTRYIGIFGGNR